MKEKFFALSRFKQIVFAVIAFHMTAILALLVHHVLSKEKPKSKIVVRTFSLPQKIVAPRLESVPKGKKEAPKTMAKPPNQATKKTQTQVVKETKKTQKVLTQGKSKEPPSSTQLLQEIEKDLAALEKKTAPSRAKPTLALPSEIVAVDFKEEEREMQAAGYGEILVSYLQSSLDLPEMGEVKVDLELNFLGEIISFQIIEAKSKKNSDFLKKRLPELALPCFNSDRKSDETAKFTITFKNRPPL